MRDLAVAVEDIKDQIEAYYRDIRSGTLCDLGEYKTHQKINRLKNQLKKLEKK